MTDRRKSPCGPFLNNDRRKGDRRKLADRRKPQQLYHGCLHRRGGYRRASDLAKNMGRAPRPDVVAYLSVKVGALEVAVDNWTRRAQAAESKLAEIRKVVNGS